MTTSPHLINKSSVVRRVGWVVLGYFWALVIMKLFAFEGSTGNKRLPPQEQHKTGKNVADPAKILIKSGNAQPQAAKAPSKIPDNYVPKKFVNDLVYPVIAGDGQANLDLIMRLGEEPRVLEQIRTCINEFMEQLAERQVANAILKHSNEGDFYSISKFDCSSLISNIRSRLDGLLESKWKVELLMESLLASKYGVGFGEQDLTVFVSQNTPSSNSAITTLECYSGSHASPENLKLSVTVSGFPKFPLPVFKNLIK
jgi:hypothetical protein